MVRPILRLATRLTRRTRLTAWTIAFACMVLVGSLFLVDGLANGVGSVADRIAIAPFVYQDGEDLLASRIDPSIVAALPSDTMTLRVHGGFLDANGVRFDVAVAAVEFVQDGKTIVPFPAGRDDVALDSGLRDRIEEVTASEPSATGDLEVLGARLTSLPLVNLSAGLPDLLPDGWAFVRPDLLIAVEPVAGGPIQAIVTENALDADVVASFGLTRIEVVGAVGFVKESTEDAAVALRLLAVLIAVLIALLVYSAMSLEVHQRSAEIATLRSLGTSPRMVLAIYEVQALVLAGVGAVVGAALGILIGYGIVSLTPLVGLPNLVVLRAPLEAVALTAVIALLAAGFAGIVPSRRAAALVRSPEARPS